jgi:histone deacetylase complex regulatory component SIN3
MNEIISQEEESIEQTGTDLGDFVTKCREKFDDETFLEFVSTLKEILERKDNLKTEVNHMRELLRDNKELLHQFLFLIPTQTRDTLVTPELTLSQQRKNFDTTGELNDLQHAKSFLKTMSRLNYGIYIDFLEMLIEYNESPESTSFNFILQQLETILSHHPQLILAFSKYFYGSQSSDLEKLFSKLKEKKIQRSKSKSLKRKSAQAVEDERESNKARKVPRERSGSFSNNNEKYSSARMDREDFDVSILNLDALEKVNINYFVLPKDFQKSFSDRADALGKKVLNNSVIICEPSVKHLICTPNEYSKVLFLMEDDQYELDILIETIKATILRVEQFIDILEKLKPEKCFNIDALFPVIYRKCIENCFDGNAEGKETFSFLYTNPATVVHDILAVLIMKLQDYLRAKKEWATTWRSTYKKYSYKALNSYRTES